MLSDSTDIANDLAAHLTEALCCDTSLSPDTDLLATGLVDSLMMADLLRHVESSYGVRLEPDDLRPRNFRSPQVLAELILRKVSVTTAAPR